MKSLARLAFSAAALSASLSSAAFAGGLSGAPAPFDKGGVKVALISYISAGDFFQAYQAGAEAQAKALDIDLRVFPGRQDAAQQREQILQAINLGVAGIVVDHGLPESLSDVVQQAVDKGIKVVAFDVNLNNPKIPQVEQSDHELAQLALKQAVKDNGTSFKAGYVYVAGFAPLDRRNEVFEQVLAANPGLKNVATFGTVSESTAAEVQTQAAAVLTANPGIKAIFAPYDEFAKGATLAVTAAGLQDKVKVYGADVSTADIDVITADGSPWVATAGTDPGNVGRVAVRAAALLAAGEAVDPQVVVNPALTTQQFLRDNAVTTIEQLGEKLPALDTPELVTAPWFESLGQ